MRHTPEGHSLNVRCRENKYAYKILGVELHGKGTYKILGVHIHGKSTFEK
jgi:hypothetical protein